MCRKIICGGLVLALSGTLASSADAAAPNGIDAFNRSLIEATTHMDNAATMALWEEDGVSLLPETKPMMGKKAIAEFMDEVMKQLAGARMEKFEMKCFDVQVANDWATEWCLEHQRVALPGGKPPFEGWGKILLVLHRGSDGKWRLRREMWNQGVADQQH
jgi:uncharacterized protein (TIGR02246 family)